MNITKLALLLVVFVDIMGQGLLYPILTTLMLDLSQPFLPASTPQPDRSLYYGAVIAAFFFAWFLGAAYISQISDMIGRKKGIQICLAGGFLGYALTIVSLFVNSFWLLLIGRVVTGFTNGNQPIAQAAMIDLSESDQERMRNLGLIVSIASIGLVAGPILGGVLSDHAMLGSYASLKLPFYVTIGLVAATMLLVTLYFREKPHARRQVRIEPLEIFLVLWRALERPAILRISLVFFCFNFFVMTFVIFMDNYLTDRFGYGTFMNSMAMVTFGACVVVASPVLPPFLEKRTTERRIIVSTLALFVCSALAFVAMPSGLLTFIPVAVFAIAFSVGYPTLLSIYSLSVDESEQGWVMGVTIALFTLAAGLTSLIGGEAMDLDIRMPFFYGAAVAGLAIVFVVTTWGYPAVQKIVGMKTSDLGRAPAGQQQALRSQS
jgi:DHA1 family tetracycline resistance protein-like MFS transporter